MLKKRRASVFVYVLLLIQIILVIWYVVFNNVFILNNNINIWKNAEEVFSNVHDKWNINIETVRRYNSNGDWYIDTISCPTNVTMSWTVSTWSLKQTWIITQMTYSLWSIYCSWMYNWDEFRIFFNNEFSDFKDAYYKWDLVDIVKSTDTNIYVWATNIALSSTKTWSDPDSGYSANNSADSNDTTWFLSDNKTKDEFLKYEFPSNKSIWWITIKKDSHSHWQYWRRADIFLYDSSGTELDKIHITWMRNKSLKDVDLKYRWLTDDVKSIKIEGTQSKYLDLNEFEIYELLSTGSEELWMWDRVFTDSDSTLISFNSDWIGWWDDFDDDFNSDNYRVTSIDDVYYANWYQDDDVVPRLVVFWNMKETDKYYNIFWNNYKTNDFIDKNTNNDDILNVKIWDVDQAYLHLDLFNETEDIDFDMKILEFDPLAYKNDYTLLPVNTFDWLNITTFEWYIQNTWSTLDLSTAQTWNEYEFDFKNKDYAIFLTSNIEWNLSFRLTWETLTGTMIYINPIDDSSTWTIESLSNHIIIWWEKNFIWEEFIVVWDK